MYISEQYLEEFLFLGKNRKYKNEDIGKPDDMRLKKLEKEYVIKLNSCSNIFSTREKSIDPKVELNYSIHGKWPSGKVGAGARTTTKENMETAKCKLFAEYEFLTEYLNVLKKGNKSLCSSNDDIDACYSWIENKKSEIEDRLIGLRHAIRSLKGDAMRDAKVFQRLPSFTI